MGEIDTKEVMVKSEISRNQAIEAVRRWWHNRLMARDLKRMGRITECQLKHVPYWKIRVKVDGYVDGNVEEDHEDYITIQHKKMTLIGSMTWIRIATDAGDIGIDYLKRADVEALPREVSATPRMDVNVSKKDAVALAEEDARKAATACTGINNIYINKVNAFTIDPIIVFYPFWLLEYTYEGRTYKVTVDGVGRDILAGKAPGDHLLREISFAFGILILGILAILTYWAVFVRQEAGCPVCIVSVIGILLAISLFNYHSYGSEIRRSRGLDRYGYAELDEMLDTHVVIDDIKVDTVSSGKVRYKYM